MDRSRAGRGYEAAAVLLAWGLALAMALRPVLRSGFTTMFGDRADALIEISILEHWRNVFLGFAPWDRTFYFFPNAGTLAYNDGYFLHGCIYALFRGGFDPILSEFLAVASLKSIGFFACYWLVAKTLGWSRALALGAAVLLTVSNNMYLHAGHSQIQSLALLPLVGIALVSAVRLAAAGQDARARLCAVAFAALMGVWLVSAYYFAWFVFFTMVTTALAYLIVRRRAAWAEVSAVVRGHAVTLAIALGALLLATVPFLLLYLPKLVETGGHGYMIKFLVLPTDSYNVGDGNLLWGWILAGEHALLTLVDPDGSSARWAFNEEHSTGFPLLFLALALSAAWIAWRDRAAPAALRIGAGGILLGWLLTLQLWFLSPWLLVHYMVPGASGIRVVLRYQLFLVLPLLLLIVAVHGDRFRALWQRSRLLGLGLAVLLVAEQWNTANPARLDRPQQLAELEAVPPPPADCAAFFVVDARRGEPEYRSPELEKLYPHNVDAMYLAERWRVPTVNGFSTFNPPFWDFADAADPGYTARVAAFGRRYGITRLCGLDMRRAQPWTML